MGETERQAFMERVGSVLGSQQVGVLATRYRGGPHLSLVAYTHSGDLREIFFVTPVYTRKAAAIGEDPNVSLMVDNRQNVERDFDACVAVTARGVAEPLTDPQREDLQPAYLERHPYLEEFASSPSCRFFRIRVHGYTLVSRFQDVEEITLP
jgi:heme iron utilization protein